MTDETPTFLHDERYKRWLEQDVKRWKELRTIAHEFASGRLAGFVARNGDESAAMVAEVLIMMAVDLGGNVAKMRGANLLRFTRMAIEVNKARNEWTDEFTRWFLDGVPSLESYPDYYGSGDLYEGENFKPKGS